MTYTPLIFPKPPIRALFTAFELVPFPAVGASGFQLPSPRSCTAARFVNVLNGPTSIRLTELTACWQASMPSSKLASSQARMHASIDGKLQACLIALFG